VKRWVLVADDSLTIQKKAQGILNGAGFEVETVSNGVAAIKKLPKIQPLVVLADVSMPGRDGYEVCDFVKNSAEFRHVPVLLIASDLEPYDEQRGVRVGASGKITKPFEPRELISMVTKFAAVAEAAAPQPEPAKEVISPPFPEPVFELAPIEEEPGMAAKQEGPAIPIFAEGIAFAEPAIEEVPAAPPEGAPTPRPAEPVVETEVGAVREPPLPGIAAAAGEEVPVLAEPVVETEVAAEVALEAAPPAVEEAPLPAEPVVETEVAAEVALEAAPPAVEEAPLPVEPVAETVVAALSPAPKVAGEDTGATVEVAAAPAIEETPAEPVLIEEPMAPTQGPATVPITERTLTFAAPAHIAEPVLSDETAPAVVAPPVEELPAQPVGAVPEPPLPEVAPATSLEAFTLSEAATGQVRFAAPEPELGPPVEPVPAEPAPTPSEAAAPGPAPVDLAQVHAIVYAVVAKMSPPVLSPEVVEDLARKLADEIAAELGSALNHTVQGSASRQPQ
jgi:CheY-like chemotaxis protein